MSDVDQALAWAQANPTHPQAQSVMAKAWALQNPGDPRSDQIMQKLGQPPAQGPAPASPDQQSLGQRLADPQRWQAIALGSGPRAPQVVQGTPPMVAPASAAPEALNSLASYLSRDAGARIGTAGAMGMGQAAATGSDPTMGGLKGLGMGLLGEGAGALISKVGSALGGKAANMSEPEVAAYQKDPDLAEGAYRQYSEDPSAWQQGLRDRLREAKANLYEDSINPKVQDINKAVGDKPVDIEPSEIQGETLNKLKKWYADNYHGPTTYPNSAEVQQSGGLYPVQPVEHPPSLPEEVTVPGREAMPWERESGNAANYNPKTHPIDYKPKAEVEAADNAYLNKQIKEQVPDLDAQNAPIAYRTRISKSVDRLMGNNPDRILTNNPSRAATGPTPLREVRQVLDEEGGGQFQDLADALSAGKAMHAPNKVHSMFTRGITIPAGRAAVRNAPDAGEILRQLIEPQYLQSGLAQKRLMDQDQ